jgi:alanine racemase
VTTPTTSWLRPSQIEVDLGVIADNVRYLRRVAAPAAICAVVKADGYGHGALPVARAALAGGATRLAVALAEEGRALRQAGIGAPILVLSEPPPAAMGLVVDDGLTPLVYTRAGLEALEGVLAHRSPSTPSAFPVHLCVDTGMHRVGARPSEAFDLARLIDASPWLELEGLCTHFPVADEPERDVTTHQLEQLFALRARLAAEGIQPAVVHAANSAGTLLHPSARCDFARAGIAVYGLAPAAALRADPLVTPLRPALTLRSQVSFVQRVGAGEGISYGLHYRPAVDTVVATVPLGYGDGVPRRLSFVGGEVLIGGARRPIAGSVTMDQLMVDCGPQSTARAGDEVVLLGRQGTEEISAWDWAERLGTIAYEVTCALTQRVARVYVNDPAVAGPRGGCGPSR